MGGYESVFEADLVGCYLHPRFSISSLRRGSSRRQSSVNRITESEDIQFTMDVWKPREPCRTVVPKKDQGGRHSNFPALKMSMQYDEEEHLCFEVYSKTNFETKYLNADTTTLGLEHAAAADTMSA